MTPFDPAAQKSLGSSSASPQAARASVALAMIALALGTACILSEQWGPGLIFIFAAAAGIMTAWQLRSRMGQRSQADERTA
jgi:hypothetical protein